MCGSLGFVYCLRLVCMNQKCLLSSGGFPRGDLTGPPLNLNGIPYRVSVAPIVCAAAASLGPNFRICEALESLRSLLML